MDEIKNLYKWDPKFVSSEGFPHIILKFILGMIHFMAASQYLPGGIDSPPPQKKSGYPVGWPRLKLGTFQ
jgi:hypothetical protein